MSEKKTAIVAGESQSERYLVIEARWTEPFLERFVLARRDEESLRERIAGIGIIGIGFGSCETAVVVFPNRSSRDAASKTNPEKLAVRREDVRGVPQSPRQRRPHSVGLKETRRIGCAALQRAIAGGVLMFYSRGLLGAAIRALVAA